MSYSQKKFLSFPLNKQHKKAAELLRLYYEQKASLKPYREIEAWLKLPPIDSNPQVLADRFHFHLKLASVSLKEHNLLQNLKRFDRLSQTPYLPIAIYLDHLRSGHNIGSIMRTTEAFRLGTVHFSSEMPDTKNKKVKDASMGTSNLVPLGYAPLIELPKPLIALETVKGARSLFEFHFPKTFTLLIGNEEYGLSEKALKAADHMIEIPLQGSKNSLNVACAFGIVAAEIRRQYPNSEE